jgi:hypothetical protein|tara:strand:+ start:127 stop:318 length:192 start_codon:yes stop_codon:yes gene_type:complete
MNKIKFLRANDSTGLQKIQLNGLTYKPYTICQLADTRFGQVDEDGFSYITNWFNYKGLTYIAE